MSRNNNNAAPPPGAAFVESALWTFSSYLRREGLRFTRQRRCILEKVLRRGGHFDAEELHRELAAAGHDVSLATVYRTLSLLQEAGVLKEVLQSRDRAHYEVIYGHAHHDHMICVECGKVIEFCDERIEDLQRRICREYGFQTLDHRMGIRGVCSKCREAEHPGNQGDVDESG
jgi:Fur family ferric uptake transcriptional regulator